ncbi:MAG: polysaccharide deacetylase family protein [Pseudomonadota bacterium]|nr:polysaccharide deacetylase family protein [Pseudomonadota bacterium]
MADFVNKQSKFERDISIPRDDFTSIVEQAAKARPTENWPALFDNGQRESLLITFDDGWKDFLEVALPILEDYDVPCILFVTTEFISGTSIPFEMILEHIVSEVPEVVLPGGKTIGREFGTRDDIYDAIRKKIRPLAAEKRSSYVKDLRRLNPQVDWAFIDSSNEFLNWDQLRWIDKHPLVEIASHGAKHSLLSRLDFHNVYFDLSSSRRELEQQLDRNVRTISYPYGSNSVLTRWGARLAGYYFGFTTAAGTLSATTSRMAIPRTEFRSFLSLG